jgi:hypothetical protein
MRTYHCFVGFALTAVFFCIVLALPPFRDEHSLNLFLSIMIIASIMALANYMGWHAAEHWQVESPLLMVRPVFRAAILALVLLLLISAWHQLDVYYYLAGGVSGICFMFLYLFCAGLARRGMIALLFPRAHRFFS